MSKSDKISVKPIRTFEWGGEIKTPRDEPFDVEQHEAAELRANGLVSTAGDKDASQNANKMAEGHDTKPRGGRRMKLDGSEA